MDTGRVFSKKREKVNTLKRNVHILLPIEVVPRELDYKLVFASEMAKFGHKVFLGEKKQIWRLIEYLEYFIYLDKGYHENISDALYKKN